MEFIVGTFTQRYSQGTPTKRQVSKRFKNVSKRLKRQVYKTSSLQNVKFTKRQVSKRLVSKPQYRNCQVSYLKSGVLLSLSHPT
jgi:hypothetical protein